jgi:hypothetical protein
MACSDVRSQWREPSFWMRESRHFQQGLKTRIAGLIAYAIDVSWRLPEGVLGSFHGARGDASEPGASWKAALYRTAGSTVGALSAAVLSARLGFGAVRTGAMLFVLAVLFPCLTTVHPSFNAAGFTAAPVLSLGSACKARAAKPGATARAQPLR